MFERATIWLGTTREQSKVAFIAGSSQHGKHLRASVGSNCVHAKYLVTPFLTDL